MPADPVTLFLWCMFGVVCCILLWVVFIGVRGGR